MITTTTPLARLEFTQLLARIAAPAPAPGGGATGALAVALGIACGTKAIHVSLKHHVESAPENAQLRDAAESLQAVSTAVLALADADGIAFERLLEAYKLPKTTPQEQQARRSAIADAAGQAAQVGQAINEHAQRATHLLDTVQDAIHANILSDFAAAQKLFAANQSIQQQNIAENLAIQSRFRS